MEAGVRIDITPTLGHSNTSILTELRGCTTGALRDDFHRSKCGCSSVVEHLLAKEDVASSSLVTRSNF